MAGRHAAEGHSSAGYIPRPVSLGHPREVRRNPDPFWAYLDRFTIPGYARDFFSPDHHRSIVGFICGVLFVGAGLARMVTDPGWQSLGVIFVGGGVAVLCFLAPLLVNLAFASTIRRAGPRESSAGTDSRSRARRRRSRRRY